MTLPSFPLADNRNRTFKTRNLLDKLTEYEIRKHCGMPRQSVRDLVEPVIRSPTSRGHAIPSETKFITASFFRSGSFQYIEGSVGGISQASTSRIIDTFSKNVVRDVLPNYLRFPNDQKSLSKFKADFFEKAQYPNIFGIVNGTHVIIHTPKQNEYAYVNRKLKHSINVQVVSGPKNEFNDLVVKWPGSTHDSFIWKHCRLRERLISGEFGESWVLGDSGYPLEPWLMTPVETPVNDAERRFNKAHRITRSHVERSIGIWKIRFRSMHASGGTLWYSPEKCCQLIAASVFLQNYCILHQVPLLPEDENDLNNQPNDDMTSPLGLEDFTCVQTRENLMLNYFSQ